MIRNFMMKFLSAIINEVSVFPEPGEPVIKSLGRFICVSIQEWEEYHHF
jgi:hypothetical protein